MLTRRVTFRLYPNNSQCDKLHWARKMHCDLYNAAIANRRTQYKHFGYSVDYFEQQNCLPEFKKVWVEYAELGSQTLQATLKRVDIAYQRFFKGLGKHPKFKAKRRYAGWTYPNKQSWRVSSNDKNGHPDCNHVEDRDVNAAQVNEIWARGQELSSLDAELPSPTAYGSMKQLGTKKRQKQRLQRSKSP